MWQVTYKGSLISIEFRILAPEGVSAPILTANGSRSVIVRWAKPLSSNGKITKYRVQRRESGTNNLKTLVTLNASLWNIYVDTTVKPFQSYDYLIIAETSVGGTSSPYNTVTTPQGGTCFSFLFFVFVFLSLEKIAILYLTFQVRF